MATTCTDDGEGMVLCRKSGQTTEWSHEAFEAHLAARAVPVGPGGSACGEDDTGPFVRIHLPDGYDATADVDAFTPAPNPYQQSKSYLRQRHKQIKAKTPAQQTATPATERDLLAVMNLIRPDDVP